jgi:hypothetical protein
MPGGVREFLLQAIMEKHTITINAVFFINPFFNDSNSWKNVALDAATKLDFWRMNNPWV